MKRLLKWVATLVASLVLLAVGFMASFTLVPITQRLTFNICYIADYETVFCQKGEDAEFYYWRVVGIKDGETVQLEIKVPKLKVGRLDL